MSKVLIFSDIHVTSHKKRFERLTDCLKVLEWVFETALQNDITDIVFAGDLFHERQKIETLTYHLTFNVLEKYLTGKLRLYLLLGNHDLWYHDRWDINSVKPFSALPGVTVIDTPQTISISGNKVDFLPYTHTPIEHLDELRKSNGRTLFAHLAVHGSVTNVMHNIHSDVIIEHDGEMVKVDASVFHGWDQVFLGHYHGEQKISNNAEYIGSPLQLSFGEAFQHKHAIIYDVESGEKQYIRNTFSPQHFIIKEQDVDKYDIQNNFIQLLVPDLGETHVADVRRELQKLTPGSLEVIPILKEETQQLVIDCKAIFLNEMEMMKKWVEEAGHGDLIKEKCLEKGTEVCEYSV